MCDRFKRQMADGLGHEIGAVNWESKGQEWNGKAGDGSRIHRRHVWHHT